MGCHGFSDLSDTGSKVMGARAGIAATPACMAASVAIAAPISSVMRVLPLASMWTYWREKGGRVGSDFLGEHAAHVGE